MPTPTGFTSIYTSTEIDAAVTAVSDKADKATTLAGYGITDAYNKADTNKNFYAIYGGSDLALSSTNTVNLNSLIDYGSYYNGLNARAQYCTNRPTSNNVAFRVYVSNPLGIGSVYRRQIYQEFDSEDVYQRTTTDSGATWTSWTKVQGAIVTVYSGSSAPISSTGSDGDIYIQTS